MSERTVPLSRFRELKNRTRKIGNRRWAEGVLQGVCSQLGPDGIAIDCGANLGDVTAQLAATGARVVAFEPDPFAYDALSRKAARLPNVEAVNAAVGPKAATMTLWRHAGFDDKPKIRSQASTLMAGNLTSDPASGVEVEVIDFPAFVEAELENRDRIDFLKIDIEGAEIDLLNALEDRDLLSRIRLTVVETHEAILPHLADDFAALRARIAAAHPASRVTLDWH